MFLKSRTFKDIKYNILTRSVTTLTTQVPPTTSTTENEYKEKEDFNLANLIVGEKRLLMKLAVYPCWASISKEDPSFILASIDSGE